MTRRHVCGCLPAVLLGNAPYPTCPPRSPRRRWARSDYTRSAGSAHVNHARHFVATTGYPRPHSWPRTNSKSGSGRGETQRPATAARRRDRGSTWQREAGQHARGMQSRARGSVLQRSPRSGPTFLIGARWAVRRNYDSGALCQSSPHATPPCPPSRSREKC